MNIETIRLLVEKSATWILLSIIRCYQLLISPLLGQRCRYYPSCSHYASIALERHGVLRGSWLAIKRIGRCHPGHPGGIDYPPACDSPSCANTESSH